MTIYPAGTQLVRDDGVRFVADGRSGYGKSYSVVGGGKTTATVDTSILGDKIQELKDQIQTKRNDAENLRKEIDGLQIELAKLLAFSDQLPQ